MKDSGYINALSSSHYTIEVEESDPDSQRLILLSNTTRIAYLLIQNFEVPEIDITLGNRPLLSAYYSSHSKESFSQYLELLKKDLEYIADNLDDLNGITYKFLNKDVAARLQTSHRFMALKAINKKPLFSFIYSAAPLKLKHIEDDEQSA